MCQVAVLGGLLCFWSVAESRCFQVQHCYSCIHSSNSLGRR
jgi:hypothetical protein